jgi:hypothetical protein
LTASSAKRTRTGFDLVAALDEQLIERPRSVKTRGRIRLRRNLVSLPAGPCRIRRAPMRKGASERAAVIVPAIRSSLSP